MTHKSFPSPQTPHPGAVQLPPRGIKIPISGQDVVESRPGVARVIADGSFVTSKTAISPEMELTELTEGAFVSSVGTHSWEQRICRGRSGCLLLEEHSS
jgi:hypothetical protein